MMSMPQCGVVCVCMRWTYVPYGKRHERRSRSPKTSIVIVHEIFGPSVPTKSNATSPKCLVLGAVRSLQAQPIVMMRGTLWKSTDAYVGSLERRYCVLVGTLMLDFESQEDFINGAPPKAEGEVIGVSSWRVKGIESSVCCR